MKKSTFALAFFMLSFKLTALCQADGSVLSNIVLKLQSFYSGHIIEKAYLQFNKSHYAVGDTIYFKAYVTSGEEHLLSGQSSVLYVDLIDPQTRISQSIKLQLKNGLAWGDFALLDSLRRGNYRIRAYTKLMMKEPGTCFFDQLIPIDSGIGGTTVGNVSQKVDKPDLQFFAEGGELLNGVESKLAFKAINADGLGINVKGVMIDNTGKTVTSFASSHLGMGVFNFTPEDGKTYKANVTFADGSQTTVDLPATVANGIVLAIDNSDSTKLSLGFYCSKSYFDQNNGKVFGLVMNSGVAVSKVSFKLSNQLFAVDLKKNQFKTGIEQFTLFSPSGEPLSERLAFIQHNDMLKLNVRSDKTAYKPREKVSISLNAKKLSDSVAAGHFSVSVIVENKMPSDDENSILSWMLLSSDLKGYIEQPNYYFTNVNGETQANLDILMLTQGYRRFTWNDLLAGKYPAIAFQPEKGLDIKGVVTSPDGKPLAGEKVNLICIDGGPMLSQTTDTAGRFDFTNMDFTGSSHFMIKAASSKNKALIAWHPERAEAVDPNTKLPQRLFAFDSLMDVALQSRKASTTYALKNARPIKEAGPIDTRDESPTRSRYGRADQVIKHADLQGSGILSDHLNGLLNGVTFTGDLTSTDHKTPYLTAAQNLTGNPPMQVIVDGTALPLGSGVDDIDINDVEAVEVFKNSGASAFGSQGGAGVLYITSVAHGSQSGNGGIAAGILPVTVQGFYKARQFYTPKYDHLGDQKNINNAIFWEPELITDKSGNTSFEFFNADATGTYRIVIEGIDEKGNLGRRVYRYKVE